MAQPAQTNNKDNCCQILMCGDGGSGKTALCSAFIGSVLSEKDYNPTIHNEYHKSNFMVDGINMNRIDIKDVQGQEEYLDMRLNTISDSDAFILVYDITQKSTFSELNKWITEIKDTKSKENEYKGIPIVIVGMKCDLAHKRAVYEDSVQILSSKLNDAPYFEACATTKQTININKIFESIIREWRKYEKYSVTKYENKIKKRKQKSKMENFLNGFGLFSNKNEDNIINEPLMNNNINENKLDINNTILNDEKEKVLVSQEMDLIVEDMFQDQLKAHEQNINNLEKQKENENKNENNKIDLCLYNFQIFLKDLKLSKYENIFIENGFGDLEKMLFLDNDDLQSDEFKIIKSGERKYLLKKLQELNKDYEKFKEWIEESKALCVYCQPFCSNGIITMKILIESIDVNDKNTLKKLIKFYSNEHLDMFWNKIQTYLHPPQVIGDTYM